MLPHLSFVSFASGHGTKPGSISELYNIWLITVTLGRNLLTRCYVNSRGLLVNCLYDVSAHQYMCHREQDESNQRYA
jgi:hypothetical protein